MGVRRVSVLSREPLPYSVAAQVNGDTWTPGVGATFEAAYLPSPLAKPTDSDWVAGTFDTTSIGTVRGLVLIGPGTPKVLAAGKWYEWTRVTDPVSGARPVDQVGELIIE
jgi:hypothetical protein